MGLVVTEETQMINGAPGWPGSTYRAPSIMP